MDNELVVGLLRQASMLRLTMDELFFLYQSYYDIPVYDSNYKEEMTQKMKEKEYMFGWNNVSQVFIKTIPKKPDQIKAQEYVDRMEKQVKELAQSKELSETKPKIKGTVKTYEQLMRKFIEGCGIPNRIQTSDGTSYNVNRYSDKALKVFIQIMHDDEIDKNLFGLATKLYYARKGAYVQTLTNYLIDRTWEGEYLELKKKVDKGESLTNYVDKEVKGTSGKNSNRFNR